MKKTICLGASILDAHNKLQAIKNIIATGIDIIHYDVMDGEFVAKSSLPIDEVKRLITQSPKHIIDIHLMVYDVKNSIQQFKNIADYITFHFEAVNEEEILTIFNKYPQIKFGLAIKPSTPLSLIKPYLSFLTHVLIMTVEPGKGGQKFMQNILHKISSLKKLVNDENLNLFIGVDGGIDNVTGPLAIKSGAHYLVSGSYLLKNLTKDTVLKILTNKK